MLDINLVIVIVLVVALVAFSSGFLAGQPHKRPRGRPRKIHYPTSKKFYIPMIGWSTLQSITHTQGYKGTCHGKFFK